MLFVVDKPRLQRIIAIVRDDRTPGVQIEGGPFLRMEAVGDHLRLTGLTAEAQFPATVYEPGVLFLRVTTFRKALRMLSIDELGTRYTTIQVGPGGLMFEGMRFPLEEGDMLLYPDPETAPDRHPAEVLSEAEKEDDPLAQGQQGELFG